VNFLGTLQNEWAGAQAFSSFDTYMAPFVRLDHMTLDQVRQCVQELVFNLNVPSRWGSQCPFTNLTFDWTCPSDLAEQTPLIGGEPTDFTYGELQAEMDLVNQAFLEVMGQGDADGRVFTFPIPTYNITEDFDWDSDNAERLFAMTAKYGLPYFQNFINSDLDPGMIRSMCCRLQLDLRELLKRGNGLFGSAELTGSVGVVTVNMARLGYLYAGEDGGVDEQGLLARLDELLELGRDTLERRRSTVQELIDTGLYPYTKRYLGTLDNHFSTLGVNGMNEMVRNATGDRHDLRDEVGQAMSMRILEHVRARMVEFQESTGHMYNLEATPAEGATYRFAKEDRTRLPGILQAGTEQNPYYTNSSQLPVDATEDPFAALELQDDLQRMYTGGTVLHLYMNEQMSSAQACKELVRRSLTRFRLPYLTITPTFSICPRHGYLAGEHPACPRCAAQDPDAAPVPCEVWTRVMGYFRPVSSFNTGKKGEFAERRFFTEQAAGVSAGTASGVSRARRRALRQTSPRARRRSRRSMQHRARRHDRRPVGRRPADRGHGAVVDRGPARQPGRDRVLPGLPLALHVLPEHRDPGPDRPRAGAVLPGPGAAGPAPRPARRGRVQRGRGDHAACARARGRGGPGPGVLRRPAHRRRLPAQARGTARAGPDGWAAGRLGRVRREGLTRRVRRARRPPPGLGPRTGEPAAPAAVRRGPRTAHDLTPDLLDQVPVVLEMIAADAGRGRGRPGRLRTPTGADRGWEIARGRGRGRADARAATGPGPRHLAGVRGAARGTRDWDAVRGGRPGGTTGRGTGRTVSRSVGVPHSWHEHSASAIRRPGQFLCGRARYPAARRPCGRPFRAQLSAPARRTARPGADRSDGLRGDHRDHPRPGSGD
jgi:anaerobic ribonucleoside-triphosphate reductase